MAKAKILRTIDLSANDPSGENKRQQSGQPRTQPSSYQQASKAAADAYLANPEIYQGNTFTVNGRIDEKSTPRGMTYSMRYGRGRVFFGHDKPNQGDKGTLNVTREGLYANVDFSHETIDSRVSDNKQVQSKPVKEKKKVIPNQIGKLEDIPFGVSEEWDSAKRYAIGFETKVKNKTWSTWSDANTALIEARNYFATFTKENTKGDVLEKWMDQKIFHDFQQQGGSYDREKAEAGHIVEPVNIPKATAVKRPPKARVNSGSGKVLLDYNPENLYFVLAYGNNSTLNPLVLKADKRLYQGNAHVLAGLIEDLSETDVPEKQQAAYRSLTNVINEFKKPAERGRSKRYLITFNNQGAKQQDTQFHGNWRVLDEKDWSESNMKKIESWIYDDNAPSPEKAINVLKVQLTQEVYGGLERSLL